MDRQWMRATAELRQGRLRVVATVLAVALLLPLTAHAADPIPLSGNPQAIVTNPVTNKSYLAGTSTPTVTVLNHATRTTKTITITPEGQRITALALNPDTNLIYGTNIGTPALSVIDGDKDVWVLNIALAASPTAVAVDSSRNRIWVTMSDLSTGAGSVSVIDGATNTIIGAPIPVGAQAFAVAINPATDRVYVANATENTVSVINGSARTVVTTVAVGSDPTTLAVNVVTNKIYVVNFLSSNISVINGATNTAVLVPLPALPNSLAINPVTNRIYVSVLNNSIATIDGATDLVLGTPISVTGSDPWPVAVNVLTNQIVVGDRTSGHGPSENSSQIWIIDGTSNRIVATEYVLDPAFTLALNPITNLVTVPNPAQNTATVIDVNKVLLENNGSTLVSIPTGAQTQHPHAMVVNPATNRTYLANGNQVVVLNGTTVGTHITLGGPPRALAVNPITNRIYATLPTLNQLAVIDGTGVAAPVIIPVGSGPSDVAVNTVLNRIFVANESNSTVTVIDGLTNTTIGSPLPVVTRPTAILAAEGLDTVDNAQKVYVVSTGFPTVSIIDAVRLAARTPITLASPVAPRALAYNPDLRELYVLSPTRISLVDAALDREPAGSAMALSGVEGRQIAVNVQNGLVCATSRTGDSGWVNCFRRLGGLSGGWAFTGVPQAFAINPNLGTLYVAVARTNPVCGGCFDYSYLRMRGLTFDREIGIFHGPEVPTAIAVNPATNRAYLAGSSEIGIVPEHSAQGSLLFTTITPLPGNIAFSMTPTLPTTAATKFANAAIRSVYYQVDSWTGAWRKATQAGAIFNATTPVLAPGVHVVHAFATDTQAPAGDKRNDGSHVVSGNITSYTFVVGATPRLTSVVPNTGPAAGGTPITITGSNFGPGASVLVGSTLATSVTVASSTSLTAVTPPGAGVQAVSVGNPAGGYGSIANAFTYTCAYSVLPTSAAATAAGGPGSFTVATSPGCPWTRVSNASFITVTGPSAATTLTGPGTIDYTVAAGPSQNRSGTITITGTNFTTTVTVNQTGCAYNVAPAARDVPGGAGADAVTMTTSAGCPWTATSDVAWLVPAAAGTGGGSAGFTFTANSTAVPRVGHLNVGGPLAAQKTLVTVTQAGSAITSDAGAGIKPSLSGSGRYLAFQSAEPLVAGDTNGVSDIFVRDRATGTIVRVSLNRNGDEAHGASMSPVLSANGRFVVFESDAPDLVPDDTNGVRDVFLRDRDADGNGVYDEPGGVTTEMVSRSAGGAPGRGASSAPAMSPDGRFIVFASDAPNLVYADTNGLRDIFVRDRAAAAGSQVSRENLSDDDLPTAAGVSDRPSISADGRYVAFESESPTLVAGDTNNQRDVFVRDRTAGTTIRVSVTQGGGEASLPSSGAVMATSGDSVTFTSSAALVASDANGFPDIYRYTLAGGTIARVTIGAGGGDANGGSSGAAASTGGTQVVFTTNATNLATTGSPDGNSVDDVYVRNMATGEVRLVSVPGVVGAGTRSFDAAISGDGTTIAFSTESIAASAPLTANRPGQVEGAAGSAGSIKVLAQPPVFTSITPASGPAGQETTVQLRGTNLNDITKVFFDGVAATHLEVLDDQTLVMTAPARPAKAAIVDIEIAGFLTQPFTTFTYQAGATACAFTADPGTTSVGREGGQRQINVGTAANCSWSAAEAVDWLTVVAPAAASGNGPGSVSVQVAPNDNPAERAAAVVVNGVEVTVKQAGTGCGEFSVTPASRRREAGAAAGDTDREVTIQIGPGCDWTASAASDGNWLHVTSGDGPGIVRWGVDANPTSFERVGTLTVQGVPITITQLGQTAPSTCTYTLNTGLVTVPATSSTASFSVTTPAGCPWSARSLDDWLTVTGATTGTGTTTIALAAKENRTQIGAFCCYDGGTRRGTVVVAGVPLTVEQLGALGNEPFGTVDEPREGQPPFSGSVPMTGWALDDTGVTEVMICRVVVPTDDWHPNGRCPNAANEPREVYVGSAIFIRGARPDVRDSYPTTTANDRAGWGLMLLTNQLPDVPAGKTAGGNGTFTFVFRARDGRDVPDGAGGTTFVTGNLKVLGRRTITVDNATAAAPFGAIDTPGQGETIGGTAYAQFGWALTPKPKTVPKDGSTIQVLVNGVVVGSPSYNHARPDVGGAFPGYNNSDGPVGALVFDTTILPDGLHTISWIVKDDQGAVAGIGSRFFSVKNSGAVTAAAVEERAVAAETGLPISDAGVQLVRGTEGPREAVRADRAGTRHVALRAVDVGYLSLGGATGTPYEGYVVDRGLLRPLPAGSTLDATSGTFAWQLGPGFVGVYDLVFIRTVEGQRTRIPVRIVVQPHSDGVATPLLVSQPKANTLVDGAFTIQGWALSGAARQLRTVDVYAYPTDGAAPFFAGQASVALDAPVTATSPFGGQFARDRFSIEVSGLSRGSYDLLVVGRSTLSTALDASTWVGPITVR